MCPPIPLLRATLHGRLLLVMRFPRAVASKGARTANPPCGHTVQWTSSCPSPLHPPPPSGRRRGAPRRGFVVGMQKATRRRRHSARPLHAASPGDWRMECLSAWRAVLDGRAAGLCLRGRTSHGPDAPSSPGTCAACSWLRRPALHPGPATRPIISSSGPHALRAASARQPPRCAGSDFRSR